MNDSDFFRFKNFTIRHQSGPMKISTDSVLLGAWTVSKLKNKSPRRILDIGSGTGILSLMLSQAFPKTQLVALEPDKKALEDARYNIENSSFSSQIHLISKRLQDYIPTHKYDVIITNPPYFPWEMETERRMARSDQFLHVKDIFSFAREYGISGIKIFIVFPVEQAYYMLDAAYSNDFFPYWKTTFRHDEKSPWKRTLWGFSDTYNRDFEENFLTLFNEKGEKTLAYKMLTENYYL